MIAQTASDNVLAAFGPPRSRVLDVCAGEGDWLRYLIESRYRVVGLDPSPRTTRRLVDQGIEAHTADPGRIPAEDGSFDAVLVRHLLRRLSHPHRALAEWLRVLRPGGRLVILEPHPLQPRESFLRRWLRGSDWRRRLASPPRYPHDPEAPFRTGLASEELRTLLDLADVSELHCYDLDPSCLMLAGRKAQEAARRSQRRSA